MILTQEIEKSKLWEPANHHVQYGPFLLNFGQIGCADQLAGPKDFFNFPGLNRTIRVFFSEKC